MTEEEYRKLPNSEYFSASFLKMFNKEGPESLVKKVEYDNKGTFKGSVVDALCFDENNFENIYYVSTVDKEPTETESHLIKVLHAVIEYNDIKSGKYVKEGLEVIKQIGLWKNIKNEDILIGKLKNPTFKKMLVDKFKSKDKIVISGNDYMNALNLKTNLLSNDKTKPYFLNSDIKKKQILFQIPILFEMKDDKFKCLLDIIFINHEDKTIRVCDLKTGFDTNSNFKWTILKYRYDIQAALYTKALETYIIDNGLKDYSILDPLIIYTQVSKPDRPLVFRINRKMVHAAFQGFTTNSNYIYKGILELVEEINWHREKGIYHYTKEEYEEDTIEISKTTYSVNTCHKNMPNDIFNNYTSSDTFGTFSAEMTEDLDRSLERYLRYNTIDSRTIRRGTTRFVD